jgi:hypothetical protein
MMILDFDQPGIARHFLHPLANATILQDLFHTRLQLAFRY